MIQFNQIVKIWGIVYKIPKMNIVFYQPKFRWSICKCCFGARTFFHHHLNHQQKQQLLPDVDKVCLYSLAVRKLSASISGSAFLKCCLAVLWT